MPNLLLHGLYASTISTFHWLYICALGVIARKCNYIDNKFKTGLSKVITNIILPCFIFTQIVNNFRISQYLLIIHAIIGCLIIYVCGLIIGFLIAKILGLTKAQTHFLGAVFSTPHNTSIFVILIQVIGPFLDQIFPSDPNTLLTSDKRGLLYVIINSIFANIWKWSCCYYLIDADDEELEENINSPLLKDNEEQSQNQNQIVADNKKTESKGKSLTKSLLNMPLIASLFSLGITLIPPLQRLFITPKAFLRETLINVNITVSKSYSFVVIFILGLSIAENLHCPGEEVKKLGKNFLNTSMLIWLSIVKLILMPILATPVIIYLFRNIFQADDVLTFTYLFLGAAPPAINIIVICTYKNVFVNEISSIMIVMYTAAIVTLTLSVTGFFYILGILNEPILAAQRANAVNAGIPTPAV